MNLNQIKEKLIPYALLVVGLTASISSNAATLDIASLNLTSVEFSYTSPLGNGAQQQDYIPPETVIMGGYHGTLMNQSSTNIDFTVLLESTAAYGAPPLSGSIDTVAGKISLDLSSLHLTTTGIVVADFDIWNEASSSILMDVYDPATDVFSYSWSDSNTALLLGTSPFAMDYTITFNGTVSAVPVPAAVWLFGSGLLGLLGLQKRRKAAVA